MKKEILFYNETLFMNPEIFDFDYVPEEFMYRSEQMQELAHCLKPAISKKRPINCMLSGLPATGKTTSIKKIIEELRGQSNIVFVYINGRIHNTTFRVYSEIHKKIFEYTPPESGVPVNSLYQKIFEIIKKENKILIVIIDDAVFLDDCDEIIYQLSRSPEIYKGTKIGIVAVLSEKERYIIEDKSASVFCPRTIEYPKYEFDEIFNILKTRVKHGFYPGVISDDNLFIIAEYANNQDLRFGIELLRQCAIEAENKSRKNITNKDIETVVNKMLISNPGKEIDDKEKIILDILNKNNYNSGDLYKYVNKKLNISYSSFYRIIEKMEKKKLIKLSEINTNNGRTRMIERV